VQEAEGASGRVIYFRPNSFQQLGDVGRDPPLLVARFLIFVKAQSRGFDIVAFAPETESPT
jgi:hypothetical protein